VSIYKMVNYPYYHLKHIYFKSTNVHMVLIKYSVNLVDLNDIVSQMIDCFMILTFFEPGRGLQGPRKSFINANVGYTNAR
jgi:hypothetical protein